MNSVLKKFSPAIFVIALICFFLPFLNISCSGQKIISLTGIQLVTGTNIEQSDMLGQKSMERVDPEPLVVVVFVLVFIGLILSFLKGTKGSSLVIAAGAIGAILLLIFKTRTDNAILKQGEGALQAGYGVGFWLTFLCFLAAAVLNVILILQSKQVVEDEPG